MSRKPIAVLLVVAGLCLNAEAATPEASLELGLRAFRAGDYASASTDLTAAAAVPEAELQTYVSTGQLDRLQSFETALVYLALAQFRLGGEDDSRQSILRLLEAERLAPVYTHLALGPEAAEFEMLVRALVPDASLPPNGQTVVSDPTLPLPAVKPIATPTEVTVPHIEIEQPVEVAVQPEPEVVAPAAAPQTATTPSTASTPAPELSPERSEEIAQAMSPEPVLPAVRPAPVRSTPDPQPTQTMPDVDLSEVVVQPRTPERLTPDSSATTEPLPSLPARPAAVPVDSAQVRQALNSLRQAEAFADQGELRAANEIYMRLAATEPREIVAAAAVGLYRTGAYREAVQGFRRLGALGRGEEDLHYYFAVSLYESGEYETARHELMCALPYIELTSEVARYRIKIEQASAQLSASR
jgi:tetratricopeptide (TPR) repeat protein